MHSYKVGIGATVLGVALSREDLERLREVNPSAGDRLLVFSADLTEASQRGNCRVDPSAGSGDNCPSTFKRPWVHAKAGESGAALIVLKPIFDSFEDALIDNQRVTCTQRSVGTTSGSGGSETVRRFPGGRVGGGLLRREWLGKHRL
jgi:hypothetical protein